MSLAPLDARWLSAWLPLVLLAASGEPPAPAPAGTAPVIEEQVEVTAPLPTERDIAAFATRIGADEASSRGADLADLLRRVPGARVQDYGGLGSYATLSLRGSTSQQVTVMVDGVPQNRALGGPVDLSWIPATQVADVTVYRGFAPASYGLGGLGGVVDVRTNAARGSTATGQVDLLAGELGTARLSGSTSFATTETGRLSIGVEGLQGDGDFVFLDTGATFFDPSDDVERRRENNAVKQTYGLIQHAWDRTDGDQVRVGLRLQDRERGVPGLDGFPSVDTRLDESLQDLTAGWSGRTPQETVSFEVLGDVFHHEVTFDDREGQVGISAQDRTTTMWGGGAVATFGFATGRHRPLARVELRAERARVEDRALELADRGGGDRTLINLTAEDVVTLGRLTLAPSVRWETVDDRFQPGSDGTVPAPAESGRRSGWSGKFALSYALGPRTRLRGSVGHFYRNPSLTEFFGDRGAIVGNPRLLPEDGDALELGVSHQWRAASVSVELVGFARRTDNLIRLTPVGQGVAMPRNLGRVATDGIESSVAWNGRRGFYAQASATAQRVTDVTTEPRPVPYQPELIGFVGAGWQNRQVRVRWDLTYTGSNSTDTLDTPELRMPERVVHDLAAGYRFRSGVELGVDVRNLFDRQNRDLLRYPLPGRVVLVHLGWQSKAKAP